MAARRRSGGFARLLRRIYDKHRATFPTIRAFAKAVQIDETQMSRAMGQTGQPFDVRRCLRLASVTGENASVILRAADKGDIADAIERLYGTTTGIVLRDDQQQLLLGYMAIPTPLRDAVLVLVQQMARGQFYREHIKLPDVPDGDTLQVRTAQPVDSTG